MRSIIFSVMLSTLLVGSSFASEGSKPLNVRVIANDCAALFDNLTSVTASATSLTAKEQSGLVKISADAKNLYVIGKTGDALVKLNDYKVKLDQLAATLNNPKPKISVSDEQALRQALNEVIACVSGS